MDFALEVTLYGSRKKDLELNVERFAALGIPEYFVFDRRQRRLYGWRLADTGRYEPIVPQSGLWASAVLGLDLAVESERVRFYMGTAAVPELAELVARANAMVDSLQDRADSAEIRAEEERQRADEAEQRVRLLEAELQRLGQKATD